MGLGGITLSVMAIILSGSEVVLVPRHPWIFMLCFWDREEFVGSQHFLTNSGAELLYLFPDIS